MGPRAPVRWVVQLLLCLAASGVVGADEIRLKDGTTLSASVLDKDPDRVVIAVPRSEVAAIDGQPLSAPVTTGTPAPSFIAIDTNGTRHALADSAGHVTLIQFWATWCPHCRADLPLMDKLARRYHEKGFDVLAISVDKDLKALQAFLRDHRTPYPVIPAYGQPPSTTLLLPELYEIQGIPAYYLIDAQGVIAHTWSGSMTETKADLEGPLTRLLAASSARSRPPSD